MPFAALFAVALIRGHIDPQPALWLQPDGQVTVQGRAVNPIFSPGTRKINTGNGVAFDFDGKRSGILLGDIPALQITDSMTISVWLNLRSYVNDGPGAQILFRGDDRCGLDPYSLVIEGNQTVNFGVSEANGHGMKLTAEIALNKWTHVQSSFDAENHKLDLWINGEHVAFVKTSAAPFGFLDNGYTPGVSIGNVQNEKGPHNQPINGQIGDLRVYRGAFSPDDLGIRLGSWFEPPRTQTGSLPSHHTKA